MQTNTCINELTEDQPFSSDRQLWLSTKPRTPDTQNQFKNKFPKTFLKASL